MKLAKCWRCGHKVPTRCSTLCNECHRKEMKKIHARDTPTTPEVSTVGRYEPPLERLRRPTSSGRRVIRKGNMF